MAGARGMTFLMMERGLEVAGMRALSRSLVVVAGLLVLLVLGGVASAEGISKYDIIRVSGTLNVTDKGDVKAWFSWAFPRTAEYSEVKALYPNPYVLLREAFSGRSSLTASNKKAAYNDAANALDMSAVYSGAAAIRKRQWELDIGKDLQLVWQEGIRVVLVSIAPAGKYIMFNKYTVGLPSKATGVKYSADTGLISYTMPDPVVAAGQPVLDLSLKARPRIMGAAYKSYANKDLLNGSLWVAKLVLKNAGKSNVRDIRVSYRLGEYTDWSDQSTYAYLVPGAVACDVYYPIISSKVTELRSPVQVDLQVKVSYKDEKGNSRADTASQRITMLGINQFEFSNLLPEESTGTWQDNFSNTPLVPIYVTRLDEPVKAFAGMASQLSGGAGASIDDEGATAFAKAVYDLEVANGMSYQTPSGFLNDYAGGQDVKFPRDVLRDKSGTCLDLAITYASVCHGVGLDSYLMLIPGHAFPVVVLPSGDLLAVEATSIGGAAVGKSATFAEALRAGKKAFEENLYKPHFLISISEAFTSGMSNPELPRLDADVLQKWGYKLPQPGQAVAQVVPQAPAQAGARAAAPDAQGQAVAAVAGVYTGHINLLSPYQKAFGADLELRQQSATLSGQLYLDNGTSSASLSGRVAQGQVNFTAVINGVTYSFVGTSQGTALQGQYSSPATGEVGEFQFVRAQ